ncbi:NRDE domain protein [Leptospira perolatii]|uniref:NRDE domain protein n=1 Tax=Leptospira perolatii TaxID=2023191 RepID=A0A2M9ZM26_9LEPT|nr:NRDE family protein [Leptospira perolatii]PJZ69792.1 NRDE domain protein [Leptospira perolatii]PJZ72993.1 NRDE domain protein [Leptospira perolatii]
MCTTLIYRDPEKNSYGIGFNRDESIRRLKSLSPTLLTSDKGKAIAPVDGDAGGTWIGINSSGEIICVLNYYEAILKLLENPLSRGQIVRSLLLKERELESYSPKELENYYPFKLFRVCPKQTTAYIWNGSSCESFTDTSSLVVYGSSFTLGERAEVSRRKVFQEKFLPASTPSAKEFITLAKEFLSCHFPEKGAYSPCMHREDAHTVSRTIIVVDHDDVSLLYKPLQPCEDGIEEDFNFTLTEFRIFP